MIRSPAWRLLPLLCLPPLLGACCGPNNASLLNRRLQAQLTLETANGRAVVQPLPSGAQVTLTDQTLFPNGGAQLDARGRYVLASLIEGLLDPNILQISLASSSATPPALQQARGQAVRRFFEEYFLGPSLQPAGSAPVAAASGGTTITVTVAPG
jgi:hypothetical protein